MRREIVGEGVDPSGADDTRDRLLGLLCRADRTAGELARELEISANGARWHLERLEREGMVARRVVRRGVGRPAHEYRLTAEGTRRLSRAYLPVLSSLLSAMEARGGDGEGEGLLREAGRLLARRSPRPDGGLRARVEAAVALLAQLGGSASVREDGGTLWIQGACCPLRALVPEHPRVCTVVEAMLEEYLGAPVRERCEKAGRPACRLAVGAAANGSRSNGG